MPKVSKGKLKVSSNTPWGKPRKILASTDGETFKFKNYDEAREFAKKQGYSGIRIN